MHRSLRVLVGLVSTTSAVLLVASGCGSSESGSSSGGTDPSEDGGTPSSAKIDAGSGTTDAGSGPKTDAGIDSGNGDACEQGSTKCTGDGGAPVCVDTKTDPANCGQCGKACTADQECTAGACVDLCPTPAPDASFTSSPSTIYPSTEVTFTPAVTTGVTYEWTFPSGTPATSTAQEPKVTWAAAGTYAVKLEITQGKCVQTTTTNVIVSTCAGSVELSYTGAVQDFVVPACVTAIGVDAYGAQGGTGKLENGSDATGGMGGRAQATVPVTGGETLHVFVGGMGQTIGTGPTPGTGTGGFNGGGDVFDWVPNPGQTQGVSGTGGGASDVRRGNDLADRLIVAGGGGGGGGYYGGGAGGFCGGAGGSSWTDAPGNANGTTTAGVRTGNGRVVITW